MPDVRTVGKNPKHLKTLIRKAAIAGIAVLMLVPVIAACSPGSAPESGPEHSEATKLVFTEQPVTSVAGESFRTKPVVTVQDSQGNAVTDSPVLVTLSIEPAPEFDRAVLYGGKIVGTAAGEAAFNDLSIKMAASGYRLTATSDGLATAISEPFDITPGAPAKLAFTTQPYGANAGAAFITPPVVTINDAYGNPVTDASAAVALRITPETGMAGAVLYGNSEINAVNGVAAFNDISIKLSGYDYSLTASSSGLSPATSYAFNVVPGSATTLVFITQLEEAAAGSVMEIQPALVVSDSFGNRANYTGEVTMSITEDTGAKGALLAGTTTIAADHGLAQFSDLSIDLSGAGYSLTATGDGLAAALSNTFDVVEQ